LSFYLLIQLQRNKPFPQEHRVFFGDHHR
jgi:hypothetical protein